VDWLAGTDPGWMRLRLAGQVMIAIGIALAVEWGFVAATGAAVERALQQGPRPPRAGWRSGG
jgi:hypothetical protein